ncbi:Spy0128 family protein [Aminicella lysinilytica]|uniref:LPXTG-motif cell wall-anchored protein/pilin isopeptide linkage protein n=1 Tax=Aminicella lysinilytica TaxID=433323 RepID=A0A4R6PWI0_9FIRM|nr:FctA domain-containing protein [Aminicella lysinilytica]TDP44675.1 LPXTG-motif cell wall-anchored protein/pilin isopeptide linkage protein [Aminicella lysinilytica]
MRKKLLTLLLAVAVAGMYTFGSIGSIFATTGQANEKNTDPVTTTKEAKWADKDQGIAQVNLKVHVDTTQKVETKTTRVVLVIDRSGSMNEYGKMSSLKKSAKNFVDKILAAQNADVKVAIVSYAGAATTDIDFSSSKSDLHESIDSLNADGGTNIQAGIHQARALMSAEVKSLNNKIDNKFIVVLSDGEPTYSYKGTAAVSAADAGNNYNSSEWPYRITAFNYDNRVGNGGDYELEGNDSYIAGGVKYTAIKVTKDTNLTDYLYKDSRGNYHQIKYQKPWYDWFWGEQHEGYYYYKEGHHHYAIDVNVGDTVYKDNSMRISNNGYGTVSEAYLAKTDGNTLYSIGFHVNANGYAQKVMNSVADANNSYNAGSDLTAVFSKIAGQIVEVAAGTAAKVTDIVGSDSGTDATKNFTFTPYVSEGYSTAVTTAPTGTSGNTVTQTGDTYTWTLCDGDLKAGDYTLTYYVKLDLDKLTGDRGSVLTQVATNNSAELNYTVKDSEGKDQAKSLKFEVPTLNVTHYTVNYYYGDDKGTYTKDATKAATATAIVGCTDMTATTDMINNGAKAGYTYSKAKYGGSDNNTSLKIIEAPASNTIDLYYDYTPDADSLALSVTKELTGKTLLSGQFKFQAIECDKDGNALDDAEAITTTNGVENDASKVTFAPISYSEAGTHYYAITEVKDDPVQTGVKYDSDTIIVKVDVAADQDNAGKLKATPTYPKDNAGNVEKFVNEYAPKPVDVKINATKNLSGWTFTEDNIFEFELSEVTENNGKYYVAPGSSPEVVNNDDSSISFAKTYKEAGTYYYTLSEVKGQKAGYDYDSHKYLVMVDVKDVEGQLKETITYYHYDNEVQGKEIEAVEFKNSYDAEDTDPYTLTVGKLLNGINVMTAGQFTFKAIEVTDAFGNTEATGAEYMTATNDANGKVEFKYLTFTDVGTYYYKITEVNDKQKDVTYDTEPIIVSITVSDKGSGKLTAAEPVITTEHQVFANTYKETTEFTINKIWADNSNSYNSRPDTITVDIYKVVVREVARAMTVDTEKPYGTFVETITMSAKEDGTNDFNKWTRVMNLPKYEDGNEVYYYVKEAEVSGYKTEIANADRDMFSDITNTYEYKAQPPVVQNTTYNVVANYYTSNDEGATYTQDNATAVEVKTATAVQVGDPLTVTPEDAWATYDGNSYFIDADKSEMSKIAVFDAASNTLTLNYYRNAGGTDEPGEDNKTDEPQTDTGSDSDTPSNNKSAGVKTGDNNNLGLWAGILGASGVALAGLYVGLRKRENND